jgi:hypothetical protein
MTTKLLLTLIQRDLDLRDLAVSPGQTTQARQDAALHLAYQVGETLARCREYILAKEVAS